MTNKQLAHELEPCPFCGREAKLADNGDHAYVFCASQACPGAQCESDTVAEAITAWNTRALRTDDRTTEPSKDMVGRVMKGERLADSYVAALSTITPDRDIIRGAETALNEVVLLLGELLDGPSKGEFFGIDGTLKAKLETIRSTAIRALKAPSKETE